MSVRVRFAPSPTGFLHLGNARTALLNWLFAHHAGGDFWLRLDDTDKARSAEHFTQALQADLAWMGLTYTHFVRQSERMPLYQQAIDHLKASGRLYPCYETPEELDRRRKLQLSQGRPPLYDRAALQLSAPECQALEKEGRRPHWRFRLREQIVSWTDLVRDEIHYDAQALSDPIVIREDGTIVFLLAGAVDDLDMRITHILRGEDHIANTAAQIQMMEALGGSPSSLTFGHFSLITDDQGHGFSKRLGSLSLHNLRSQGIHPLAIASVLEALGTSHAPLICGSLEDLVQRFDMGAFGRATPKLDVQDLWQMNAKLLHHLPWERFVQDLPEGLLLEEAQTLWPVVHSSLSHLNELLVWQRICLGPLPLPPVPETPHEGPEPGLCDRDRISNGHEPGDQKLDQQVADPSILSHQAETGAVRSMSVQEVRDRDRISNGHEPGDQKTKGLLEEACTTLPPPPWDATTWEAWTSQLKERTGFKGRALFHPLRLALTGLDRGPEMKYLLPLLGYERVLYRLKNLSNFSKAPEGL